MWINDTFYWNSWRFLTVNFRDLYVNLRIVNSISSNSWCFWISTDYPDIYPVAEGRINGYIFWLIVTMLKWTLLIWPEIYTAFRYWLFSWYAHKLLLILHPSNTSHLDIILLSYRPFYIPNIAQSCTSKFLSADYFFFFKFIHRSNIQILQIIRWLASINLYKISSKM